MGRSSNDDYLGRHNPQGVLVSATEKLARPQLVDRDHQIRSKENRQSAIGDAKVFKKIPQMKRQMKREALVKINRVANEVGGVLAHVGEEPGF